MDDDTIVDTDLASAEWVEAKDWDGRNHISRATGSQWAHQTLYRSRSGRYYLVTSSQYQGTQPEVCWVTDHEAAAWLLQMEHELPETLADYEAKILD